MRFTIVGLVLAFAFLFAAGCGPEDSGQTRTEGARDSAIAESQLPGAGGVGGALRAADSAEARRAIQDSILMSIDP
jgi:hypothetical protein